MSITLFVDPGVHACGAAIFGPPTMDESPRLLAAGFPAGALGGSHRSDRWRETARALRQWVYDAVPRYPEALFIELPQVYDRRTMSKAKRGTDPNDLIELAAVVGAICGAFGSLRHYVALPREWKGTMPKEIMHARATGAGPGLTMLDKLSSGVLTPAELAVIPKLPRTKLHNVLDAISMGLVFYGRLRSAGSAFDGNPARVV